MVCQGYQAQEAHPVHCLGLEPYTEENQDSLVSEEYKVQKETQDSRE